VADQAVTDAMQRAVSSSGGHQHATHHGRPASWIAISIIIAGFAVGGGAMLAGPSWILFWVGAGIVVIGGIMALSTRILDDWY
jgi:hypothetical protein